MWIIRPVGVVGDAAAAISLDLVLVDDPIERGAVAEAIVEDCRWDAAEGEEVVVVAVDRGAVGSEVEGLYGFRLPVLCTFGRPNS